MPAPAHAGSQAIPLSHPLLALQAIGGSLVPTLGGVVQISGLNLGGFGITSNVLASLDSSVFLSVLSLTQTSVTVVIPPGDGATHYLQVSLPKRRAGSGGGPTLPFSLAARH